MLGVVTQLATQWKPYGDKWNYTVRNATSDEAHANPPKASNCVQDPQDPTSWSCSYFENSVLDLAPGALIGLNVGLVAGLLGAYLPDQSRSGPTAQRVLLVDLAVAAGAVAGATFGCVAATNCLNPVQVPTDPVLAKPAEGKNDAARAQAATAALIGAAVGAVGGVLLTRHFDDDRTDGGSTTSTVPIATFAPMRDVAGGFTPAFAAMGFF
jgi:hypothetical protein